MVRMQHVPGSLLGSIVVAMVLVTTACSASAAKGMQLAAWQTAMGRAKPPGCTDSRLTAKTTLGGEPALTWTTKCFGGGGISKIAALHRGHGYMTIWEADAAPQTAADRRVFES